MNKLMSELCGGESATEPAIQSEVLEERSPFSFCIGKAVDGISGCDVASCCTRDISDRACGLALVWR